MKNAVALALWMISLSALAGQALQDEYYSNDIFTAIEEAKIRTHHYDYSSALRYNRSTSQSIQIPRLLNKDMEKTSIETPDLEQTDGINAPIADSKLANNSTDTGRLSSAPNQSSDINMNHSPVTVRTYLSN